MLSVLVTGSNGGIGSSISHLLKSNGYFVIGTDIENDVNGLDAFIKMDMFDVVNCSQKHEQFTKKLCAIIKKNPLYALVNNAAVQILDGLESLSIDDFKKTIDVNLIAPLVLSKITYPDLKVNKGSIVNIGSIHSKLTKPEFISYSTSKAALLGLTQSMAVDIGEFVRVNAIQPAATATDMLLDGFKDNAEAFDVLKKYHPTQTIALPVEIAEVVNFVISDKCQFMNGTILDINGGIGSRLHDPI